MNSSHDLYIKIIFPIETPEKYTLESNVKEDKISEILTEWILSNVSEGRDDTPPNEKDIYTIIIYLDLSYDKFTLSQDCGNKGLATGIVMNVIAQLEKKNGS
jgi:hypothetical protein